LFISPLLREGHLDAAEVGPVEELEHLQVLAFDEDMPGGVELNAILGTGR